MPQSAEGTAPKKMKLMKCLLCLNLPKGSYTFVLESWGMDTMESYGSEGKKSSLQREQTVFIQESKCSYSILGGSAIHSIYIGLEM